MMMKYLCFLLSGAALFASCANTAYDREPEAPAPKPVAAEPVAVAPAAMAEPVTARALPEVRYYMVADT